MDVSLVAAALKNVPKQTRHGRPRRLTTEETARLRSEFIAGTPVADLAARYGYSTQMIYHLVVGLTPKRGVWALTAKELATVRELRKRGESIRNLALRFKITDMRVRQVLDGTIRAPK